MTPAQRRLVGAEVRVGPAPVGAEVVRLSAAELDAVVEACGVRLADEDDETWTRSQAREALERAYRALDAARAVNTPGGA